MTYRQIYQTELYKMSKRKLNLILFIPSLLALIITIAYSTGNLYISEAGQTEQIIFSSIDYLSFIWMLLSGTGLYAVIIMLLTAFQFCTEIEQGQIKLMLLRIGKRIDLIIGKLLALLTFVLTSIILTVMTIFIAYYVFLVPSGMGSGEFETTLLSSSSLLSAIGVSSLSFIILILVTYLVSIRFTPFMSFIISFILMCIIKAMTQIESLAFMKYTTFSMESQLIVNPSIERNVLVGFSLVTFITMTVLFAATSCYFNKIDIK